jgi:hypothetical protein
MPGDVGLVAALLSKVFGFVVDADGLAKMKREHQLEVVNAGIRVALDQHDYAAVDLLFEQLRRMSADGG